MRLPGKSEEFWWTIAIPSIHVIHLFGEIICVDWWTLDLEHSNHMTYLRFHIALPSFSLMANKTPLLHPRLHASTTILIKHLHLWQPYEQSAAPRHMNPPECVPWGRRQPTSSLLFFSFCAFYPNSQAAWAVPKSFKASTVLLWIHNAAFPQTFWRCPEVFSLKCEANLISLVSSVNSFICTDVDYPIPTLLGTVKLFWRNMSKD